MIIIVIIIFDPIKNCRFRYLTSIIICFFDINVHKSVPINKKITLNFCDISLDYAALCLQQYHTNTIPTPARQPLHFFIFLDKKKQHTTHHTIFFSLLFYQVRNFDLSYIASARKFLRIIL